MGEDHKQVEVGKSKLTFDYPGSTLISPMHTVMLPELKTMPCFAEDVFVAACAKAGTTWTQSIVTMILSGKGSKAIDKSVFNIHHDWLYIDIGDYFGEPPIYIAARQKPPRMIKTHLPFEMLPEDAIKNKSKIIYVYRNPKDVIVSYYNFLKFSSIQYLEECHRLDNLEEFAEDFMNDQVLYTPFWGNVYSYWTRRNEPNVLFVTYEDLHKDAAKEIRRIAEVLGKSVTDEGVHDMVDASSFSKMSQNEAVNRITIASKQLDELGQPIFKFMRKGEVNNWTKHFSPELNAKVDAWIKTNVERYGLQNSGLSF